MKHFSEKCLFIFNLLQFYFSVVIDKKYRRDFEPRPKD